MNFRIVPYVCFGSLLLLAGVGCSRGVHYEFGDLRSIPEAEKVALIIPPEVQLRSVNGAEVPGFYALIGGQQLTVNLAPGEYDVFVRYRDVWDKTPYEHDTVQSDTTALSFAAKPGARYNLSYPELKSYEEAKTFAENPRFSVVDSVSGQLVSKEVGPSAAPKSMLHRVRSWDKSESEPTAAAPANVTAKPNPELVSPVAEAVKPQPKAEKQLASELKNPEPAKAQQRQSLSDTPPQPTELKDMKQWWDKATPAERAEFQRWIWQEPSKGRE